VIGTQIGIILIVTGVLTAVALLQFVAPVQTLRMIYGDAPADEVSIALACHWAYSSFWSRYC